MNFSFEAPKTQAGTNPTTGAPGFTAGATGAGDAGKTLSTGFSLPSMQPKPGGLFSSALGGSPAPSFGSPATASMGLNLETTTGAPATGLTFGTPAATAASNLSFGLNTTTTPSFGATTFGAGAPATATTTSSSLTFEILKPATTTATFSFGSNVTSAASTAPKLTFGTPSTMRPGFSVPGLASTPATTAATPAASTGFALAPATSVTPQVGSSLGSTTIPGLGITPSTGASNLSSTFSLGQIPSTAATTASTGFSLTGATTTASTGFSLTSGTASTLAGGFSLNKTTATQAPTTAVTTNVAPQTSLGSITTVSSASSAQVGTMNFCQLEESINKWTLELEEQEKAFVNQATQVNAWDKLLIANGEKITNLNLEVERVKSEQQQLEHELDYVVGQQKELQDCLVPLEKELASLTVADPEREYTYRLAENLDKQLKQMSQDLKEIIEHLNEANRSQDSSDPIVQIGKILNAHMNSLQWLDQRTTVLGQKIQQIDQMHQNFRQENERSFSLAYN